MGTRLVCMALRAERGLGLTLVVIVIAFAVAAAAGGVFAYLALRDQAYPPKRPPSSSSRQPRSISP